MSELRVAEIHNPNDDSGGIEIDNNDVVSINGQGFPTAGSLGKRNVIINGAMRIAQRGTQVIGVTGAGFVTVDRFRFNTNTGTWTVQQSDTICPEGFTHSFRMLCTANAGAGDGVTTRVVYRVEGFDCQRLFDPDQDVNGTLPMRLSFWVRSNRTGDASIVLLQTDNQNRQFDTSYNIGTANTWEHKVIEIPADADAVYDNDNENAMQIEWWLNSGTDFNNGNDHSDDWVDNDNGLRNCTNLGVASANDHFEITGVQLETGTVATSFEHEDFGLEMLRCQRYYLQENVNADMAVLRTDSNNDVLRRYTFRPSVPFRAAPSTTVGTDVTLTINSGNTIAINTADESSIRIQCNATNASTVARIIGLEVDLEI